jgi:hypothetical protein
VFIGKRMNVPEVLERELVEEFGAVIVVVSGPSEMSDEVRMVVSRLGSSKRNLSIKFLEESFSW